MKCKWCGVEISTPIMITKKNKETKEEDVFIYTACSMECVKEMKVIDKLDLKFNTFGKLQIEPDFYKKELFTTEDSEPEPECITLRGDINGI